MKTESCKKRTYKTRKGAKWFGRIFKQYYYRCPDCGCFHLTRKRQSKQTFLDNKLNGVKING